MPNWCHNTLTVSGEAEELQRFIEAARPNEASLRRAWKAWEKWDGPRPTFKAYVADVMERQPLSFESLCPQPSDEELRKLERYQICTMCGGDGQLAKTEEAQLAKGGRWYDWMGEEWKHREPGDRSCNVCHGSGQERVGLEGWYEWRLAHWGTKWDASFGEPFLGLSAGDEADVDVSVESKRATITPTVAIYKFDTAWSPPVPVIEAASEQHPELEFTLRFGEPGNDFAGEVRFLAGLTLEEQELEVTDVLAPEEMWF